MQRRTVLKAMGAVPIAASIPIAIHSCTSDKLGSKPTRFIVRHEDGRFDDAEVAKAIEALKASGLPETTPVRVMLTDRKGQAWGAPRMVFLIQGTIATFAAGESLQTAKAAWPARLKQLGLKARRPHDKDLAGCLIEIPGPYGADWPVKA